MKKSEQIVPWEKTLYKRIMMHMEMGYKPCKIDDPGKRNAAHQQEWWRRKHPNPRPIGRPRKEAA